MIQRTSRRRGVAEILAAAALVTGGYVVLQGCDEDEPSPEVCDNGWDDDDDLAIDCEDVDCVGDPACASSGDSDADQDEDGVGDGGDGDTDADVDGDVDGEGEVDGDVDGDADGPRECRGAGDCQLVLDMMVCCGGHPHRVDDRVEVCPSAAPSDRVASDPCVVPWVSGDPLPTVPPECDPFCTGIVCAPCAEPDGVDCVGGACVTTGGGSECTVDGDCGSGRSCVDPDGDGIRECVDGAHECATASDCESAYPDCDWCRCEDFDTDGLRDCQCWGCGDCAVDTDCEIHHFCESGTCTFAGDDACLVSHGALDCGLCAVCEPISAGSDRGRCVPMAGPDGGLPLPDAGC